VALPLKFAVDPDPQEPSLLNGRYCLLVAVNRRRRCGAGAGEVNEFALFWGKLHSPCASPLAARLPGAFEVLASSLCIFAKCKEVEVVSKSNCNEASVVLELGIEAGSIKEEEDRGEW
jgi:hypothetical protein